MFYLEETDNMKVGDIIKTKLCFEQLALMKELDELGYKCEKMDNNRIRIIEVPE